MKFSFKKIGSILASTAMLTSTVALAAAANFPAPYVSSAGANVAIVHGGEKAMYTDLAAVADITSYLSSELARLTATGNGGGSTANIEGEAAPLFTSGTKLYINDTINTVKSVITDSTTDGLPTVLAHGSFSGNVDASYTQNINLGFNPQIIFAGKQPTSDQDPQFLLSLSTNNANYLYNDSVIFTKAVNFTHADSKGQDIILFGQKFTVASATSDTELVLLKTAEKVSLSSDDPTAEVIIGGKTYTVELVSASDTAATIKITDSEGKSETKEVGENASKKINGITVAITNADENQLKLSASVIAGAEKVKISTSQGSSVTTGEEDTVVDGTSTTITGGTTATTKIMVSIRAPNSDKDAVIPGKAFVDPVFGTFKLDFSGFNIKDTDTTEREEIAIGYNGDDKMEVKFTNKDGKSASVQYAKNWTSPGTIEMQRDSDGHNITVREGEALFKDDYVVVGNEESGRLMRVSQITNSTTAGTSGDKVTFVDVFSGDTVDTTITADGVGTVSFGGKDYNVKYNGTSSDSGNIAILNYPDSSGNGAMVAYPSIQTSKGANLVFYEPLKVLRSDWDTTLGKNDGGLSTLGANLTSIRIPDGDDYTSITVAGHPLEGVINITFGTTTTALNVTGNTGTTGVSGAVGRLTYNVTAADFGLDAGNVSLRIQLVNPDGGNLNSPAIVVFEEKDDNSLYQALVTNLESGGDSNDGIGVNDVSRTWQADGTWDSIALASNSKMEKEADLFGTIVTVDKGDSDQYKATISYPDEQIYGLVYVAEDTASITASGGGGAGTVTSLGSISVVDSEVSSVAGKSLIVVGGSCVNNVAADLLKVTSPTCSADFTTATSVGSGQYLIETFARTGDNVATLVAGYDARDTTNAAKALTTQAIDTTVGMKYIDGVKVSVESSGLEEA